MFEVLFPLIVHDSLNNRKKQYVHITQARQVGMTTFLLKFCKRFENKNCCFVTLNHQGVSNICYEFVVSKNIDVISQYMLSQHSGVQYDVVIFDNVDFMTQSWVHDFMVSQRTALCISTSNVRLYDEPKLDSWHKFYVRKFINESSMLNIDKVV